MQPQVQFLGHIVSAEGKRPDSEKTKVIREWKAPKTSKEVRSFLGLVGYYRDFIPQFARLTQPLRIISNDQEEFDRITWGSDQQKAFDELKRILTSHPVLSFPIEGGRYIVDSDASHLGLGCCLKQEQGLSEATIAYGGRALTSAEKNYSTTEMECLGLYYALKNFHVYIYMRPVLVRTDHKALQYLLSKRESPNHRLQAWSMLISVYCPEIIHVPGT